MPLGYAVVIRERTRSAAALDQYRRAIPGILQKHAAVYLAAHGRSTVTEGPESEDIIILQFPSYEAAQVWYDSAEYRVLCEHRFRGGDYRCILTEGL